MSAPSDAPARGAPATTRAGWRARWTDGVRGSARGVRDRWGRIPLAWQRALVATSVLRLALAVLGFAFGGLLEGLDPVDVNPVEGTPFRGWRARAAIAQGTGLLGASLERFDALWYLAIARDGYPGRTFLGDVPGAAAFFPGFPLLVAGVGRLFAGSYYLAASVVAFAATVAGFAGVHRLVEVETGDEALAGRALTAIAVFPSAFFLVAPYTESLFLATSAWSLVAARRGRWVLAAPLAAYAALTRNVGVLLVIPLVLLAWRAEGPRLRALGAAVLGPLAGTGLYVAYSALLWDTPLGFIAAQTGWERAWRWPWSSLGSAWSIGTDTPGLYPSGYHSVDVVIAAAVLAAAVWLLVRAPLAYGAYTIAHILVWLIYPFPGRPLMSTYRFAIAIAPLGWAFGAWTGRPAIATTWRAVSAALLGVLYLLFVAWYYVF